MSRKIVAIGGGENGRMLENGQIAPYETGPMDEEIIRLTKKKNPNFLFMAHSLSNSLELQEDYYQTMRKIYGEKLGCNCQELKSNQLENLEEAKEKIDWADIIYEGGGDTPTMIELWKKTGFDKVLYEAWNKGKVICGISAGAVCWFKSCDSEVSEIKEDVECLGWINAHCTPHCEENGRYEITKNNLKRNGLIGILLSDCSAIEIIDNKYRIITSNSMWHNIEKAYSLRLYWEKNEFKEEPIIVSSRLEYLSRLFSKKEKSDFEEVR